MSAFKLPPYKKILETAALLLFATGIIGMLIPHGIGDQELRSMRHLPITGHILVFFLGAYLFYTFRPGLSARPMHIQILRLLFATLLAGIILESFQAVIPGRTASARDLLANITGAMIYLSVRNLKSFSMHLPFHVSVAVITGLLLWPLLRSVIDERIAANQFPLLAGFETPFEHTRFAGNHGRFSVSNEFGFYGDRSLKLSLGTETFSGLSLDYMPGDWQGYSLLHLAVYNPQPTPVILTVRIHDAVHETDGMWQYTDRYNQRFSLSPEKWTTIQIPLEDVKHAPETRKMNMDQIRNVGFFVTQAPNPLTLYLDDIRLK